MYLDRNSEKNLNYIRCEDKTILQYLSLGKNANNKKDLNGSVWRGGETVNLKANRRGKIVTKVDTASTSAERFQISYTHTVKWIKY